MGGSAGVVSSPTFSFVPEVPDGGIRCKTRAVTLEAVALSASASRSRNVGFVLEGIDSLDDPDLRQLDLEPNLVYSAVFGW